MRTARLLPVSPNIHCSEGEYLPREGGVPARGVYLPRYPPCEQNSWHTLLKILPCPKLRLRAVMNYEFFRKVVGLSFAAKTFFDQYFGNETHGASHPALNVLNRLCTATDRLANNVSFTLTVTNTEEKRRFDFKTFLYNT